MGTRNNNQTRLDSTIVSADPLNKYIQVVSQTWVNKLAAFSVTPDLSSLSREMLIIAVQLRWKVYRVYLSLFRSDFRESNADNFIFSKRSNSDYKTTLETSTDEKNNNQKIITKIELKPHKFIQDSIERCPGGSETPPRKHRLVKYGFARG